MAIVGAIANKVVVEFGLLCNGLLGTTRPKQLERTPTLGLIRSGKLVQATLANFPPHLLRQEGAHSCVSSLSISMDEKI